MTDKLTRYFELKHKPISGDIEIERRINDEMLGLISGVPQVKSHWVIRYFKDSLDKECVLETAWSGETEIAFVLSELGKFYGCKIIAVTERVYEV